MKKIKFLLVVFAFATTSVFAQDKALNIDANGNITINGSLNGVRIYNFKANQSPSTLKGMGQYYTTLTLSATSDCQGRGISAIISYSIDQPDPRQPIFKILSQAGTYNNNISISPKSPNTLIFADACGTVTEIAFTPKGSDIVATVIVKGNNGQIITSPTDNYRFNIISQGF